MKHNRKPTHLPESRRASDKVAGSRSAGVRACEFSHRPGAEIKVARKPTRRIGQRDAAQTRSRDGCATLPGDPATGPAETRRSGGRRSESRRLGGRRSGRTRIGKIARLPHEVREQLNRRLLDGEPGDELLDWLNALPKAKEVLAAQFGGRPVSKQNLSEWKQGGYQDWARAEQDRLRVDRLTEQAAQLAGSEKESPLSERLAAVLLVELAGALDDLRDESLPPAERWERLRQLLREVAQMRREDNRAAKLRIEQERWKWESERLEQETIDRADKAEKEELCAPYMAASKLPLMVEMFGGGKLGRTMAAQMLEIQHGLKPGMLGGHEAFGSVKPGPAKSGARGGSDGSDRSD